MKQRAAWKGTPGRLMTVGHALFPWSSNMALNTGELAACHTTGG